MEVSHIWEKPIGIKDNSFVFRNVRYTIVAELDSWCESGAWWHGEPVLYFSLVKTDPEGLFEIAYTPTKEALLYQSFD